ncbi:MAG: hypothetical protein EAZ95_12175 [Bacteroidetes bacterium]|nr:MAG: hypothetical protein EAZ95_12175 [Bacteroidota bacterium]
MFLWGLPALLGAQPVSLKQDTASLWIGGLNSPQVQKMDLNQDSRQDLVLFDRTTSRFFTFLALPTPAGKLAWRYAPEYESIFPQTQGWFVLRDYNRDGIKDFFAHVSQGLQGWKATKEGQNLIFQPFKGGGLYTKGLSGQVNLQVAITDIPCLHDIDNDQDLDVLIFDFSQGSYLELHLNQSTNPEEMRLERQGYCWGNVWEGGTCGDLRFDYPCDKAGEGGGEPLPTQPTHTGSTITVADLNNDQRLDLLVGDISCKRLYAIYNKGTNLKPVFTKYDTLFPASKPVDIDIFPASFVEDVNFDDVPDLLVAPNVFKNELNAIDFQHSLWWYAGKKKGKKTTFEFQSNNFLQNAMIDVGENASPALWDYDQDGDFDLLVGNRGVRKAGKFRASLHLFENIGTPQKPNFVLKTDDFWALAGKEWTDIKPFVTDSNQDGKPELHILAYEKRKAIWQYRQDAQSDWQTFSYNLEINQFPILFDFDQDKDLDLLISLPRNEWKYWENTSQNASFQWQASSLEMNLPACERAYAPKYPHLTDLNADQQLDFLIERNGNLNLYSEATQWQAGKDWIANETLFYNALTKNEQKYDMGTFAYPASADLDADGRVDLLVGLGTGGVCLFWNKIF